MVYMINELMGECSSIDNGLWHKETLQQLGKEYVVSCENWFIQDNGVAIDCYPNDLDPEEDGPLPYMWLHGAGWTDELVREVTEMDLYEDHPVYLLEDQGIVLCGNMVIPVIRDSFLDMENMCKLSECIFDYPDCVATVHCLCEGGE